MTPIKFNDVKKVEMMGMEIFEKKDPIYESTLFGVSIKWLIVGTLLFSLIRGSKR
jgi:hypothetical protein